MQWLVNFSLKILFFSLYNLYSLLLKTIFFLIKTIFFFLHRIYRSLRNLTKNQQVIFINCLTACINAILFVLITIPWFCYGEFIKPKLLQPLLNKIGFRKISFTDILTSSVVMYILMYTYNNFINFLHCFSIRLWK